MYQMRKKLKDQHYLTPEEIDVQTALKDYTVLETFSFPTEWVASAKLYDTYLTWFNKRLSVNGDAELLKVREFGAALRRVFPQLEDDDERRCCLTPPNGKRQLGFLGMRGPGASTINPHRGRPKGSHKTSAPSSEIPGGNANPPKRRYADPYWDEVKPLRPPNGRGGAARVESRPSQMPLPDDCGGD